MISMVLSIQCTPLLSNPAQLDLLLIQSKCQSLVRLHYTTPLFIFNTTSYEADICKLDLIGFMINIINLPPKVCTVTTVDTIGLLILFDANQTTMTIDLILIIMLLITRAGWPRDPEKKGGTERLGKCLERKSSIWLTI